ncbi:hypothetical protein [Virgisporangium aurantiacum]|uniref:Uncharacterized protein n=1 Tax=Virgisporangium aurantiacum TaxID=175570 RepID=A0A8J4E9S1_9ACTN|nr:hypothetical protein [Virgisporangium aurantiacum]GIJ64032.1 hypothetical protein Vau01_115480 [Virgisporangium aurantiacum]
MIDLDIAALIKQHLAGGASVQESLGRLTESDPDLAPIAQILMQREEQLRSELAEEERDDLQEQELADRRMRAAALREHLDGITAEVDALRARLADAADALGACRICFGDDRGCPWCGGRGRPGFMPPDPDGFDRLVLPALRLHVRLRGRRTTGQAAGATRERSAS